MENEKDYLRKYYAKTKIQDQKSPSFIKQVLIVVGVVLVLTMIVAGVFPVEAQEDPRVTLERLQKEYAFEEGAVQELHHQREVIGQRIVVHQANQKRIHEEAELIRTSHRSKKK